MLTFRQFADEYYRTQAIDAGVTVAECREFYPEHVVRRHWLRAIENPDNRHIGSLARVVWRSVVEQLGEHDAARWRKWNRYTIA